MSSHNYIAKRVEDEFVSIAAASRKGCPRSRARFIAIHRSSHAMSKECMCVEWIAMLLKQSGRGPEGIIQADNVRRVLQRLATMRPGWIDCAADQCSNLSTCTLWGTFGRSALPLAAAVMNFAEYAGLQSCCGEALSRWRTTTATFITLGRGIKQGQMILSRCFKCESVYAGRWRWRKIPEDYPKFPDGFHIPQMMPVATDVQ